MPANNDVQAAKPPPVHSVHMGAIRAAIWANEDSNGTLRFSATFSRRYRTVPTKRGSQPKWQDSFSYGVADCVVLSALARQVADWIQAEEANRSVPQNGPN